MPSLAIGPASINGPSQILQRRRWVTVPRQTGGSARPATGIDARGWDSSCSCCAVSYPGKASPGAFGATHVRTFGDVGPRASGGRRLVEADGDALGPAARQTIIGICCTPVGHAGTWSKPRPSLLASSASGAGPPASADGATVGATLLFPKTGLAAQGVGRIRVSSNPYCLFGRCRNTQSPTIRGRCAGRPLVLGDSPQILRESVTEIPHWSAIWLERHATAEAQVCDWRRS